MRLALDLLLQIPQFDAILLFHGRRQRIHVAGAVILVDVEAGRPDDRALPGLPAYQFPGLFRVLELHEYLDAGVGDHLLRPFGVGLKDARVVLGSHNGGETQAAPLCQHQLKARRHNGRVLVHDAEVRPDADSVRGQGFQHVGGVALYIRAEANGAGVADGGKTDFAEAGEFGRGFFQRRQ